MPLLLDKVLLTAKMTKLAAKLIYLVDEKHSKIEISNEKYC